MDDAPNAAPFTPSRQRAGNIDLSNRPRVRNADGSISTVRSISIELDGLVYLIPTVVGDSVVSNEEAVRHFQATGQYLGIFESESEADAYAEALHAQQEQMLAPDGHGARLPTDIPGRVTIARVLDVRTVYGDGETYELDEFPGGLAMGHGRAPIVYAQGDRVICYWDAAANVYHISGLAAAQGA